MFHEYTVIEHFESNSLKQNNILMYIHKFI